MKRGKHILLKSIILLIEIILLFSVFLINTFIVVLLLGIPIGIVFILNRYLDKKEYFDNGYFAMLILMLSNVLVLAFLSQCLNP